MEDLYNAALAGDLERVTLLLEHGADKNQTGGIFGETALSAAADNNHLTVVQYLVEQGADMNKGNAKGGRLTPLHYACSSGHLDVARYLLEQGADRDKAARDGMTSLHHAARNGHLETAKLLMAYGADLNARNNAGQLPIDMGHFNTVEIRQAIRDEPRRRIDEAPGKRATEQDRHPDAATSASAQQEEEEQENEQSNKRPRLNEETEAEEEKIAEEDEDSEPSDEEDGNWIQPAKTENHCW